MGIMELITYYLNQGLSFIIPLIILLGLLIFVHELGHFLVAKYFGVRVEVFSLGFGKKFFKFQKNETEYCLSVVPFGGYVKMYGDDPTADIPEATKKYSFLHKPVGQRIWIVLAGPLMNFFFAILLFTLIALVGEEVLQPVVGDLSPKSTAAQSGLKPEDKIVSINDIPVSTWTDVKELIEKSETSPVKIIVQPKNRNEEQTLVAATSVVSNPNILSSQEQVSDIEGLTYLFRSTAVAVVTRESLAGRAGFQTGDRIINVEGQAVTKWVDLARAVSSLSNKPGVHFTVEREEQKDKPPKSLVFTLDIQGIIAKQEAPALYPQDPVAQTGQELLKSLGFDFPDLYIAEVVPDSAAAKAGLQIGDKILAVNSPVSEWQELVKRVQSYIPEQPPLKVSVLRDGKQIDFNLIPLKIKQPQPSGKESEVFALGVKAGIVSAQPLTFIMKTSNPFHAIQKGIVDGLTWTRNTCLSFLRLLQSRVSAKSIGGPIMIGQLASKTFQIGLSPFLKIMAIISINLFILNLLPVPVLDGGHLVFFTIEALRGAPLSMRKMEIAQQIGLVILMSLMVLALFNDVSRLFN